MENNNPFAGTYDGEDFTDPIAAHVYCGRRILQTVTIAPGFGECGKLTGYTVCTEDGMLLEVTDTSNVAVRLAEMFLEGYLQGYSDREEIAHVPTGPDASYWRDHRSVGSNPAPPEGDGGNRVDDERPTESDGPD